MISVALMRITSQRSERRNNQTPFMLLSSQWRGFLCGRVLDCLRLGFAASKNSGLMLCVAEMSPSSRSRWDSIAILARGRIMGLDRGQDRFMLRDRARDPSLLRQRQPAIAIDVDFHLLDQRPDSRMSGDVGDGGVKHFVGVMEGVAIVGGIRPRAGVPGSNAEPGSGWRSRARRRAARWFPRAPCE